ncbi:N-acetyltransferase 9-like protein [Actinia tenebrosa]|uniref:N-acetyltransferase 9-like protein n=1 Tax=Actinia tenebrosa TaxID=6105 RepID=A0A6P8HCG7_ACTTE|nr:N-acetyltransferase 9-like protein [Actinia tenebrosa]
MKINGSTILVGDKVVLVPYREEHVPKYHDWMQSPELLEQTASERLTLSQEYDMQRSWYEDEHKCTFLILDKRKWMDTEQNEIDSMVGDVNLFFNDNDEPNTAEIEIMIAEHSCRRKGFGKEAVYIMMHYGITNLKIDKFRAKIGCKNKASLNLFNNMGFRTVSTSEVFQESTLELHVTDSFRQKLTSVTDCVTQYQYPYNVSS